MAQKIMSWVSGKDVITENSSLVQELNSEQKYGILLDDGRIQLSIMEAVYLCEKKKLEVLNSKERELSCTELKKIALKKEKCFNERYAVYSDLRSKGYIVKTGLKFGADFRVYDKGARVDDEHSRWVCYVVREHNSHTWHEFAGKNRIAHSTTKRLLIAVVDDDQSVSYWESRWIRP